MQREREEKEKLEKEKAQQKLDERKESLVAHESYVARPVSNRLDDINDNKGTDDRQFTQDQNGTWVRVESAPVVSNGVTPVGSVYPIGQQQRDMKEMQKETGIDKTSSPSNSSNGNSPVRDGASSSDGIDKDLNI